MSTTSPNNTGQDSETPYYRKFTLPELGVDQQDFLQKTSPAFEALDWDTYDLTRGGLAFPTRKRGIAEFNLQKNEEDVWTSSRTKAQPYVQLMDDGLFNRTEPRIYSEVPTSATDHPEMRKFLEAVGDIISGVRSDVQKLRMIFTFTRIVHDQEATGACTIEDIHCDGMEMVIPALVIRRQNLQPQSGQSSVYTLNRELLLQQVLQEGEGIIQDDQRTLHSITKIQRRTQDAPGIRDIIGVDILFPSPSSL